MSKFLKVLSLCVAIIIIIGAYITGSTITSAYDTVNNIQNEYYNDYDVYGDNNGVTIGRQPSQNQNASGVIMVIYMTAGFCIAAYVAMLGIGVAQILDRCDALEKHLLTMQGIEIKDENNEPIED